MGNRGRKMPPLVTADIRKMLRFDGWHSVPGGNHLCFEHPTKPGKVQVSTKWTGIKTSHEVWKGLLSQTGWSKEEAERIYWESR